MMLIVIVFSLVLIVGTALRFVLVFLRVLLSIISTEEVMCLIAVNRF